MNNLINPIRFITTEQTFIYQSNCVEFWLPITSKVIGVQIEEGRYMISSFGNVCDSFSENKIRISQHQKGYIQLLLDDIYGNLVCRKLHRIVMMTFCYIPGCEKLEVNHKNGKKHHNYISNLEWNTGSENRIHAINNDLENTIFGKPIIKLSPEEVWDIKLLYLQGIYSYNQIIDILKLREKGVHRKLIERIVNGKSKMYSGDYK